MSKYQTPMMQQYMELKNKYPDCILFFRLGDFYEMFLEDAKVASQILGITLTRRSRGKDGAVPMCGVPYHAVDLYLPRLVDAGYKVAIAEQITSPKDTPNLVVREVVRIVTAGTMIEGRSVNERESAFVCAIHHDAKKFHLALADLATGEIFIKTSSHELLSDDLSKFRPKEVIVSPDFYNNPKLLGIVSRAGAKHVGPFADWANWQQQAERVLTHQLQVSTLHGFGITSTKQSEVAAALFGYLSYTQHGHVSHITALSVVAEENFLHLDATTLDSLEIFRSSMEQKADGSLLQVLDRTNTALGARLLKRWLAQPLANQVQIEHRLNDVEFLINHNFYLNKCQTTLKQVTDIERQLSKLAVNIGNARDLVALRENLKKINLLAQDLQHPSFVQKLELIDHLNTKVVEYLDQWIQDDPSGVTKSGGMIKPGNHKKLDQLRQTHQASQTWLEQFETEQRVKTGISSLKVGYNAVFGYFIEVSKGQAHLVTEEFGFERKQTLVNAERYSTTELKIQEHKVLVAKEAADELEFQLFSNVVENVLSHASQIQQLAQGVAYIDCIVSFASIALTNNYCKPQLTQERILSIKQGRHPVVEQFLREKFVPNSTEMTQESRCFLITGPNMAGKSTYIRQVALIVVMAHLGSYVPADTALIPICDRVFSRIGASDALHKGLSTFMVEMSETAKILRQMSDRSLVIFDEIGRGTSVHDGLAIAQAIAEHIAVAPQQPFVFFATHYHELSSLSQTFSSIVNYSMSVKLHQGKMIFLRSLIQESSNESYGVEVAQQAGIPVSIIRRAQQLRLNSETNATDSAHHDFGPFPYQSLVKELKKADLENITPKQALDLLFHLKQLLTKT